MVKSILAGFGHKTLQRLKTQVGHSVRKWAFRLVFLGMASLVFVYILPLALNHFLIGRVNQYLAPQAGSPVSASRETGGVRVKTAENRVPAKAAKTSEQTASVPASAPVAKGPEPVVSEQRESKPPLWAVADADYVSDFAAHFFRISYVNWTGTLDYFKTRLDKDYFPAFQAQYFPPSLKSQMEEKRLAQTFWPTGAPKLLGWEGMSDEYLVRGTHSLEDHYNEPPQTLSKETAGVVVQVVHDIDTGKRIVKVSLATPEELVAAGAAEKKLGADLGKQIGDGVKDLNDAVNKADQGKSAMDKAKGLLGL